MRIFNKKGSETMNSISPAFPCTREFQSASGATYEVPELGLTKREYFAAKAMAAILSKYTLESQESPGAVAEVAIKIADATLKRLEATK